MLIADCGSWSDFAPGRTPESYVEGALGGDPPGYGLEPITKAHQTGGGTS